MNRNNRLSLNDKLNYILNDESDFEELDDETDSDLEAEPENHINFDDSESIIDSSDEDEPSANAAGQKWQCYQYRKKRNRNIPWCLFSNGASEVTFTKIVLGDLYDLLWCFVYYLKKQI